MTDRPPVVVELRPVTDADLPIFYEQQLDPEASAMAAFPVRDRKTFMAHWEAMPADPTNIVRTVVADGAVAGNMLCWGPPEERAVGYWLGRAFWGRGIATRALAALLAEVDDRPLFAHVARHNIGSRRVLEKCGFRVVGEAVVDEPGTPPIVEDILRLDAR